MRDISGLMQKLPPIEVRHGLLLALVLAGGNDYATHPVYSAELLRQQMEKQALRARLNWWRKQQKRVALILRDWARRLEANL